MNADLTLEQYADALKRLRNVLVGWEIWAVEHAPEAYRPLLAERRRSRLIEADLASLNVPGSGPDHDAVQASLSAKLLNGSTPLSSAQLLGAMYVVEGSTLGGQFIAKHVEEKFGFRDGRGNAYFRGYGERTGSMWRSFKDELIALPKGDADEVISAAKAMFAVFAAAMAARKSNPLTVQY